MKRPNIIFILTDDQAQWAVGAYGNKDIYTPNMDKLAEEGMLFTQAFTCPVCSPSRAMIMTGLYPNKVGIDDWISPDETEGISSDKPTMAEMLKRAGYITGLVGKWHLGKEQPYHPLNRGFDYFMGFLGGGNSPKDPVLEIDGKEREVKGFTIEIITKEAIRFIRENKDKPFALFFHTREPHMPYTPTPPEDMSHYINKKLKVPEVENFPKEELQERYRGYYASISSIDRNMGYLLEELERLKLKENTIVIFMGDNGYMIGHHGLETKGNAWYIGTNIRRPNMFEYSILVPLIIRWPEVIEKGGVCKENVCSLDFFPTLVDILRMAGIEISMDLEFDGTSIFPLLQGRNFKPHEEIYLLYDMHHGAEAHMRMLRAKEKKLVLHYEDENKHEFYDLKADPQEEENIFQREDISSIKEEFITKINMWRNEISDLFNKEEK